MAEQVFVLGGAQTDFSVNGSRVSDELLRDMPAEAVAEAVAGALADAVMSAADIQTAPVDNLAAELFTGQAHLGALLTTVDPAWSALPAGRHEAACASGSLAVLAAMVEIEAGPLRRRAGGRRRADAQRGWAPGRRPSRLHRAGGP